MDLVLWRHAEAHDLVVGRTDFERELTERGEQQARRMAAWLNRHLPPHARVLASPARRTQQTAAALERKVRTLEALAPDAGVQAVLQATGWPQGDETVVVVGHQPTLGQVAAVLMCGRMLSWSVRKGAVWWLRGRDRGGELRVSLHAVLAPDSV